MGLVLAFIVVDIYYAQILLFNYSPTVQLINKYIFVLLESSLTALTLIFLIYGMRKNLTLVEEELYTQVETKRMASLTYFPHNDQNFLEKTTSADAFDANKVSGAFGSNCLPENEEGQVPNEGSTAAGGTTNDMSLMEMEVDV